MLTVTISENGTATYSGVTDTQIKESAATTNYKNDQYMEATSYDTADHTHAILRFANPLLGGTVLVSSASLDVYHESFDTGSRNISIYEVLRAFTHDATWNTYDGTNNWQTGGGLGASDYNSTALATLSVADTTGFKTWSGSSLATYVQNKLNASSPIILMMLRDPHNSNDFKFNNFRSSNHATSSDRPVLTFTYTLVNQGLMLKGM